MPVPCTPRRAACALALAGLGLATALPAAAAVKTLDLTFSNGSAQSIWGSGGSSSFGGSGYVLGDRSFGVSYSASASSGIVRSTLLSGLSADYDPVVDFARSSSVQVGFDFFGRDTEIFGIPVPGGSFTTELGAEISVKGHLNTSLIGVPISWNPEIVGYDFRLDTVAGFDADPGARATASDAFSPASVGIGLPTFGIGVSGGAGVDLDVRQTARLDIDGLGGFVTATHRDSGDRVTRALSLTSAAGGALSFDLARAGTWDFSYAGLSVLNRFSTQFRLDIRPFIEYGIGVFCGDLGDDGDNGWGCLGDDRLSATLTGIDLFSSPELALAYNAVDTGRVFSVDVLAAPIPEPGTWLLMLAGTGALLARRRMVWLDRGDAGLA